MAGVAAGSLTYANGAATGVNVRSAGRDPCTGFTKIENEIICARSDIGTPAVMVYLALAHHAFGRKTECSPSLAKLAEMSGYGKTTVCEALTTLEAAGFIERLRVSGGRSRRTTYRLLRRSAETVRQGEQFTPKTVQRGEQFISETVQQEPGNCSLERTKTVHHGEHEEYNGRIQGEEDDARAREATGDAAATSMQNGVPSSSSSSSSDPDDPEAVEQVLLSWEWTEERLRRVLKDSGYRMYEVVRQIAKGQSIWAINDNRVVLRDDGAFLELLKAVERALASLRRRRDAGRDPARLFREAEVQR